MPKGPREEVTVGDMYRLEPTDPAVMLDATNMANSLATSPFWYRALTSNSENFEFYVQPNLYVPAFNLPLEKTAVFDKHAVENFSNVMKNLLSWMPSCQPMGWSLYNTAERIEHFGFLLRKKLTDLTYFLLSERLVYQCVIAQGAEQGR